MNPEQKNGIEDFRVFSRYVVIIVALKLMLLGEALRFRKNLRDPIWRWS